MPNAAAGRQRDAHPGRRPEPSRSHLPRPAARNSAICASLTPAVRSPAPPARPRPPAARAPSRSPAAVGRRARGRSCPRRRTPRVRSAGGIGAAVRGVTPRERRSSRSTVARVGVLGARRRSSRRRGPPPQPPSRRAGRASGTHHAPDDSRLATSRSRLRSSGSNVPAVRASPQARRKAGIASPYRLTRACGPSRPHPLVGVPADRGGRPGPPRAASSPRASSRAGRHGATSSRAGARRARAESARRASWSTASPSPRRPRDLDAFLRWVDAHERPTWSTPAARSRPDVRRRPRPRLARRPRRGSRRARRHRLPYVTTIHATESRPPPGLGRRSTRSRTSTAVETLDGPPRRRGSIVCSHYMRDHVADVLGVDEDARDA